MKRISSLLLSLLLVFSLAACSFGGGSDSDAYEEEDAAAYDDAADDGSTDAAQYDSSTPYCTTPPPTAAPPDWRSAYAQAVLSQGMLSNFAGAEITGAYLFFLNDDDIPELYLTYSPMAAGSELFTYDGNTVDCAQLSGGMVSYSEHGNVLLNRYIHTGSGWDAIYAIRSGRIVELTSGESELQLMGDDSLEYTWNGVTVSEAEYNAKLNTIANVNGLCNIEDNCFSDPTLFGRIGA